MSDRSIRLAQVLASRQRVSVHFDPQTKQTYPFLQRHKTLEKYSGRDDVFGSFTSITKLGINPSTSYNTPVGVYSYPIDYLIDNYNTVTENFTVPWPPEDRQIFLQIFRVTDLSRCLSFDARENTQVQDFKYGDKVTGVEAARAFASWQDIIKNINDHYNEKLGKLHLDDTMSIVNFLKDPLEYLEEVRYIQGPTSTMRSAVRKFYGLDSSLNFYSDIYDFINSGLGKRLTEIKEAGHVDFPQDILDSYEDELSGSLKKDIVFPYEDRFRTLFSEIDDDDDEEKEYQEFRSTVLGISERVACDEAFVWNAARHLSKLSPVRWTGILRSMGFIGAVDHGTGTIHPSEPTQAVFFDPGSIQPLERIDNKSREYVKTNMYGPPSLRRTLYNWTKENFKEEDIESLIEEKISFMNENKRQISRGTKEDMTMGSFSLYLSDINRDVSYLYNIFGWLNSHPQLLHPYFLEQVKPDVIQNINEVLSIINLAVQKLSSKGHFKNVEKMVSTVITRLNMLLKILR